MNPTPRLKVGGKAHELVLRIHEHTRARGWSHDVVLRDRLQLGSLMVALHIIRGARDDRQGNFPRAVEAALSSLREVAYILLVSRDLGLLPTSTYAMLEARTAELDRMLVGLRHRLHSSGSAARPARGFRTLPSTRTREPIQADRTPQAGAPQVGSALGVG